MLDYAFEDIDGRDDNAEEEQSQNPFNGHWTTTSTYDVYMVDTPKEVDSEGGKDPVEDKPSVAPPKRRRQRRHSKLHHEKDSNTGIGDNNTPDNANDKKDQHPSMIIGRMGKSTPTIPSGMRARRIVTTYRPPKWMRASVMRISSCQRNPLNKSALGAS